MLVLFGPPVCGKWKHANRGYGLSRDHYRLVGAHRRFGHIASIFKVQLELLVETDLLEAANVETVALRFVTSLSLPSSHRRFGDTCPLHILGG
jgi:hypothetical protein